MKIFDLAEVPPKSEPYLSLQRQAVDTIIQICKALEVSLPAMHAALWVFHGNALVMTYHRFDRFIYACAAVLVGTKLMECLRDPLQIVGVARKYLRRRKGIEGDEDTEDFLRKQVRYVFEAEVNIMLNIGFDFDIRLAIAQAQKRGYLQMNPVEGFAVKYKQTLTSLYCTDVAVLFSPDRLALLALRILFKAENRNIETLDLDRTLISGLNSEQVQAAYHQYLARCAFN